MSSLTKLTAEVKKQLDLNTTYASRMKELEQMICNSYDWINHYNEKLNKGIEKYNELLEGSEQPNGYQNK